MYFQILLLKHKKIQKPPTKPSFTSNYRSPPSLKTTGSSSLPPSLSKTRSHFHTLVRIPPCGYSIILLGGRRMLHQERHRSGQPPSATLGQAPRLQLQYLGEFPLWRSLAKPPTNQRHRNLLDEPAQLVLEHPEGRNQTDIVQTFSKLHRTVCEGGAATDIYGADF